MNSGYSIFFMHIKKNYEKERCSAVLTMILFPLLGNKSNMSKGLLEQYPDAPIMFKDTVFLDFLGLPKKK